MEACALQRLDRRRGGQQLAQYDRSRHVDALTLQVKLRDAVLAHEHERDPAEVDHRGVLQHHFGQIVGGVAHDVVGANAVSQRYTEQWHERHKKGARDVRELGCYRECQWALTQKRARGGGTPQRGHGAPLEPLAQLGDALSSVGAIAAAIEAAELVVGQTAKGRR